MLNCFNNYEIVSSAIIRMYIENAIHALYPNSTSKVQTFFDTTPFQSFVLSLHNTVPYTQTSKQYQDYIVMLGLTAVTLARVNACDIFVYTRQDMVDIAGFATMLTIANQLNKKIVMWTDDLRNIWNTGDNPLVIGMAPLPYRYLWSSTSPTSTTLQPKGLNGYTYPQLATTDNKCPEINTCTLEQCWNTFILLIQQAETIQRQNNAGQLNQRCQNLITLGDAIIDYVEGGKGRVLGNQLATYGGLGWFNSYLWGDIEAIIRDPRNIRLLYNEERSFIQQQTFHPQHNANSSAANNAQSAPQASLAQMLNQTSRSQFSQLFSPMNKQAAVDWQNIG